MVAKSAQQMIDEANARAEDAGSPNPVPSGAASNTDGLTPGERQILDRLGGADPDEQPDVFGDFFKNQSLDRIEGADRALLNSAGRDQLLDPYRGGDETRILTSFSLEERYGLQDLMWRLGYIGKDTQWGFLDTATINGFKAVLGNANQNGSKWDVLLEQQKEAVRSGLFTPGDLQASMAPEPMVLPDYDSLKGVVRSKFRDELGRDPTQAEMQQFSDRMMGDYREEALRADPDPSLQNPFADTGAGRGELVDVEPEFTNQISPGANFDENFERLYAGQRESLQGQDDAARTAQQTTNNAGVRPQNTSL
jgi:hypothetical protein